MASFYVRKSGVSGWVAYIQNYSDGLKTQRALKPQEYSVHHLNRDWTLAQAKQEIRKLNQLNKIETRKKSAAAWRANLIKIESSLYVDEHLAPKYQQHLIDNELDGDIERAHQNRILFHWKTAQKIINRVKLMPDQYSQNAGRFANEFAREKSSADYAQKLLRVINGYGEFWSQHRNSFFKPIRLTRVQLNRVRDAYLNSKTYRGPSDVLTPEDLERKRAKLKPEQYKWLYVSIWFGLRPQEIDSLTDAKFGFKVEMSRAHRKKVVVVYQSKLKSVSQDKRWKRIPILFKEQETALSYLNEYLKRPSNKTLRTTFNPRLRSYAGRKGFTDLMLEKGRQLEEISAWLGHASIETTWKHYKSKDKLTLMESA